MVVLLKNHPSTAPLAADGALWPLGLTNWGHVFTAHDDRRIEDLQQKNWGDEWWRTKMADCFGMTIGLAFWRPNQAIQCTGAGAIWSHFPPRLATAKWRRRCTPQCEDGLKTSHRNQCRSRTSRFLVPCDAAATAAGPFHLHPTSKTALDQLIAKGILSASLIFGAPVCRMNPTEGCLASQSYVGSEKRSLELFEAQKRWAGWLSYVISSNIPKLTPHFLCNLDLQQQFQKNMTMIESIQHLVQQEWNSKCSLMGVQCYSVLVSRPQDQHVLHVQPTQRSSMLAPHRYWNTRKRGAVCGQAVGTRLHREKSNGASKRSINGATN